MSNGPIFIVGAHHSGTTLLQSILRKNPAPYVFRGESRFFHNISRYRQKYPDLTNDLILREFIDYLIKVAHLGFTGAATEGKNTNIAELGVNQDQFESIIDATKKAVVGKGDDSHVLAFRTVGDYLAIFDGRTRWVEKTPGHIFCLDAIFEAFEDIRILELVRDPRAALSSKKNRTTTEWFRFQEEHGRRTDKKFKFDPVIDSLRWQQMIRAGSEAKKNYPEHIMRVRYEDLVFQPEITVKEMCSFLDLNYHPSMLDVSWINSTTQASGETSTGISSAAVEKWRKNLSKEEQKTIQLILRHEMEELGYSPEPLDDFRLWTKIPSILANSTSRLVSRLWRRHNIKKGYF